MRDRLRGCRERRFRWTARHRRWGPASNRRRARDRSLDMDAPSSPFEGLKVADFSWVGVGPMIGKALADHGATVVRIESPDRLDLLRTVPPFKDGVPGPDRAQFMANFNTSKLGMTIDLKNAEGRKLARRMVDWADVVLESYSPGTMARFGLDWATLSAERDDLVMLSTSMRGQTGRERKYSGFGGQGSAIGGLYALVGWPDRPPCGPWGAYTDFITPRFGVATLTAALLHRLAHRSRPTHRPVSDRVRHPLPRAPDPRLRRHRQGGEGARPGVAVP